jgi:hypothetical protein
MLLIAKSTFASQTVLHGMYLGIQPRTIRSRLALYNHTDLYALLIDTLFNQFQQQLQHTC